MRIDLNCDVGEGCGADERLMPLVTSANVACGFHAGGPALMRRTVRLAARHGVAVGAHPSYPDRAGFGRRALAASPDEVRDDLAYQIGALWAFCRAEGVPLTHVKPHGALYLAAAADAALARVVCEATRAAGPSLAVMCLARSAMAEVARELAVPFVEEAYADRACAASGALLPRGAPGALIDDPEVAAERAARIVVEGGATASDGTALAVSAQTICVHGDTPGAERLLLAIRARLERDGVAIRPFSSR